METELKSKIESKILSLSVLSGGTIIDHPDMCSDHHVGYLTCRSNSDVHLYDVFYELDYKPNRISISGDVRIIDEYLFSFFRLTL